MKNSVTFYLLAVEEFQVTGMKHRNLENIEDGRYIFISSGEQLILKPEDNVHDKSAIAVFDKTGRFHLGYVSRMDNEEIREHLISDNCIYICTVTENSSMIESGELDYANVTAKVSFYKKETLPLPVKS